MSNSRNDQALDMRSAQRIEVPRRPMPVHDVPRGASSLSGLASQWLGTRSRMPALRANQQTFGSTWPQPHSAEALQQAQRQTASSTQSVHGERKPRSKEEFLAFLDEWMSEPDGLGPEWWDDFDEELKANRLHFPERDLS